MRRTCSLIGIVAAAAACQPAETPEQADARMAAEAETAAAELDAIYVRMMEFVASENADSIAALYAEDARLFPADEPLVVGRAAIRDKYAEWFGMGTAAFTNERIGLTVNGPLAVERLTWTMTLSAEPGGPAMAPMTIVGKNVTVWRRVAGRWMIIDDIGNNDAPMMMPGGGG